MDYRNSITYQFESLPDYWWILLWGVAFISFIFQWRNKTNRIINILTPTYVAFIVMVTLLNRSEGGGYQLEPFWSYKAAYGGAIYLWQEIVLNYLLFIPLGFLLHFRFKEMNKIGLIGLSISTFIEVAQLELKLGLFEFDDIIGNSLGCVLGAVIGVIIQSICCQKRSK